MSNSLIYIFVIISAYFYCSASALAVVSTSVVPLTDAVEIKSPELKSPSQNPIGLALSFFASASKPNKIQQLLGSSVGGYTHDKESVLTQVPSSSQVGNEPDQTRGHISSQISITAQPHFSGHDQFHSGYDAAIDTSHIEELFRSSILSEIYRVLRLTILLFERNIRIATADNEHAGREFACKLAEIVEFVREQVQFIVTAHIDEELNCHDVKKVREIIRGFYLVKLTDAVLHITPKFSLETQDNIRQNWVGYYTGVKASLERTVEYCISLKALDTDEGYKNSKSTSGVYSHSVEKLRCHG